MIRVLRFVLVVVSLALMVSAAHAAGKTTVDPSTVTKVIKAAAPVGATDARLDAKITYDASGVRLHDVVSEIARVSGATIYCGSSPDDWRARDIPVTVAARGIPARKLLNFVTYATQTSFIEVKTEKGNFYRVVRNAKLQKKSDDHQAAVENVDKANALWSLDVACRLKDILLSSIKVPEGAGEDWADRTATQIAISRLLSLMDADTRNAALSGDQLILTPRTAPAGLRQAVLDVLKSVDRADVNRALASQGRSGSTSLTTSIEAATSDDFQNSGLGLTRTGAGINVTSYVRFSRGGSTYDTRNSYDDTQAMAKTMLANRDQSTLPKQPTYPSLAQMDLLDGATGTGDAPELNQKYTITPDGANGHCYGGDVLIALSKASGLTIVCEDYESVRKERDVSPSFGKEMSGQDALSRAIGRGRWMVCQGSKVLIGTNRNWTWESRNLLPQRLIDNLTAKADGDGIDIDDLTGLARFGDNAISMWLTGETFRGNPFSVFSRSNASPIWAFYDSLSPWEKDQTRSSAGLSLSKYDPKVIAGMLAGRIKSYSRSLYNFGDQPPRYERLLEAAVLPTLVMSLKCGEYDSPPQPVSAGSAGATSEARIESDKPINIPAGFTRRRNYSIFIEGGDAANRISLNIDGPYRLPYFSPRRERVLAEAYNKQNAAKPK